MCSRCSNVPTCDGGKNGRPPGRSMNMFLLNTRNNEVQLCPSHVNERNKSLWHQDFFLWPRWQVSSSQSPLITERVCMDATFRGPASFTAASSIPLENSVCSWTLRSVLRETPGLTLICKHQCIREYLWIHRWWGWRSCSPGWSSIFYVAVQLQQEGPCTLRSFAAQNIFGLYTMPSELSVQNLRESLRGSNKRITQ